MKILFLGVGQNIPTFIQRRIDQLIASNITPIFVVPFSTRKSYSKENVVFTHSLFSGHLEDDMRFIWSTFITITQNFSLFLRSWKLIPFRGLTRLSILIRNSQILALRVDLIHFQWINQVHSYEWMVKVKNVPVLGSARGSMVTVYPAIRKGYLSTLLKSFDIVDRIHCVSEDIRKQCISLGADEKKCFVNYNGINLTNYKPDNSANGKPFYTISIGALMWRKGFHAQLLVIKKLLSLGLDIRHKIIGEGSELEGLKYEAFRLNIADKIKFLGSLDEKNVISELQTSSIYISTSAAEGLSNSVLEAVSCGLPVVAFDCEGMNEVILDEVSGYIVDYGDIDSMVMSIKDLYRNPQKRLSFSRNAREHVVNNFDIKDKVEEMILFYKEFIEESRQG